MPLQTSAAEELLHFGEGFPDLKRYLAVELLRRTLVAVVFFIMPRVESALLFARLIMRTSLGEAAKKDAVLESSSGLQCQEG